MVSTWGSTSEFSKIYFRCPQIADPHAVRRRQRWYAVHSRHSSPPPVTRPQRTGESSIFRPHPLCRADPTDAKARAQPHTYILYNCFIQTSNPPLALIRLPPPISRLFRSPCTPTQPLSQQLRTAPRHRSRTATSFGIAPSHPCTLTSPYLVDVSGTIPAFTRLLEM